MNAANLSGNSWLPRLINAVCLIGSSWLLMQIIHEAGHVSLALLSGGTVRRVVLCPWEISRTELGENPHPLLVCWAGPLVGAVIPLAIWIIARAFRFPSQHAWQFLAGFCLISNGAYLGVGSFTKDGDAGDLLRDGSPIGALWIFFFVTVPTGLRLWHGLGKHFGLGANSPNISWSTARASFLAFVAIVTVESILTWVRT